MHNRNLAIGRSFWLRTGSRRFETMRDLELRTDTEPFLTATPHFGRVPLSRETVGSFGLAEPLHQERSDADIAPLVRLTALLHGTLGLIRYEYGGVRPFHRGAPSARCLYSSELFFVPSDTRWLGEEGAYRYDPLMHALERRNKERVWPALERSLGLSLTGAQGVLVLGADLWRIARLYGDFAYNIATLEAGHVLAQLHVLGNRLGYAATFHERFLDHELIECLGMNGNVQTPLAVVVLHSSGEDGAGPFLHETVLLPEPEKAPNVSQRFVREMSQCIDLQQMMAASRLVCTDELVQRDLAEKSAGEREEGLYGPYVELAAQSEIRQPPELLDVIKTRNSGNDRIGLAAAGHPIPYAELSGLLRELAAHPDARVLAQEVGVYLAAHRIDGLRAGIYRCELSVPGLLPVRQQVDVGMLMERASVAEGKVINFRSLPAAFYLTVDFERMLQQHGNRGYQILQMKVGRLAHYLCLLAAARGWFARPLKSYRDEEAEEMLGISSTSQSVAYQLVIGENKTPYLDFDMGL